ncbi:hypothetical protein F8S13_26905 [Chloroflexia bacterium SDU3-3]|nr:hypothetical protein F8S13_26905 [Chloroflexia bacterium SDU3-3]
MPRTHRAPRPAAPEPRPAPRRAAVGITIAATALALAGVAALLLWAAQQPQAAAVDTHRPLGGVICARWPAFASKLGFQQGTALISTRDTATVGLLLTDPTAPDLQDYQEPGGSWAQAGNLGPYALDDTGAIFVAPVPRTSLSLNPPDKQTILYRVDPATGVMAPWATVPAALPPSLENPYGLMGLAVDCATHSLYASSLAGSTQAQEVGRVVRIDLTTGQITAQLDGVDAIGLGVFVTPRGPRLYLGRARSGAVQSVLLDQAGNFAGPLRDDLALDDAVDDAYMRVRRITWRADGSAVLTAMPFTYSLDNGDTSLQLLATYDPAADRWRIVDVHRE